MMDTETLYELINDPLFRGEKGNDGKSSYEIAIKLGFNGTEEEFLASLRGKDGRDGKDGVDGKNIQTVIKEVSVKGERGDDGVSVVGFAKSPAHELIVVLSDGKKVNAGKLPKGEKGDDGVGEKGDTGVGIKKAYVDQRGDLIIEFTDGRIENVGHVRGMDGRSVSGGGGGAIRALRNKNYKIIGTNYQLKKTDDYIELSTSGTTATLYSSANAGQECHVDNSSDGFTYVTPIGSDGETITLDVNEGSYFVYNGSHWRIK